MYSEIILDAEADTALSMQERSCCWQGPFEGSHDARNGCNLCQDVAMPWL